MIFTTASIECLQMMWPILNRVSHTTKNTGSQKGYADVLMIRVLVMSLLGQGSIPTYC